MSGGAEVFTMTAVFSVSSTGLPRALLFGSLAKAYMAFRLS